MASEFDRRKSAANVALPGRGDLPFEKADEFDFTQAIVMEDTRPHPMTGKPYPERRFRAIGKIGRTLVMLVYTPKPQPVGFRTISLRPADVEERKAWHARYSTTTTPRS